MITGTVLEESAANFGWVRRLWRFKSIQIKNHTFGQGSPTWCPRAPGRPQGPWRSSAGLFWK